MNLLVVPKSNVKSYGERSTQVAAPRLWNALPKKLKSIKSLDVFKKELKTLLFREALFFNPKQIVNYLINILLFKIVKRL